MIVVIGMLGLVALYVINIIFCVIAAVKAGEGRAWEYPLTIRFLK